MKRTATAVLLTATALAAAACSGQSTPAPTVTVTASTTPVASTSTTSSAGVPQSSTTSSSSAVANASTIAALIKAQVGTVTKVVTITEDNDPNNKIGRPGGYTSAAVLYDSSANCEASGLGVGCGATVEVWPSEADAKARADFIQSALKANPALGTEYDYLRGGALLRVTGDIKPSVAAVYKSAFEG